MDTTFSAENLGNLPLQIQEAFNRQEAFERRVKGLNKNFPGRLVVKFDSGIADLNVSFSSAGAGGSYAVDTVNKVFSANPIKLVPGPAGATTAITIDLSATQGASLSQFLWDKDTVLGILCYIPEHRGISQLQAFLTVQSNRMVSRYNGSMVLDWGFADQPGWFMLTVTGDRYGFTDTTRVIQNGILPNTTGGDNLLKDTTTLIDSIRFTVTSVANNTIGTSPVTIDSVWLMPRAKPQALLMFDDCWASEYEAIEYMARKGLVGTIGVTATLVGAAGYMTETQLQRLYDLGWDLVNHANTHFAAHNKSANSICLSQTPTAGNLLLNGAVGSGAFDAPRHIVITPAANESQRPFVITGFGENGEAQTETLYGGNLVRTVSNKVWTRITQIAIPNNAAGALTIGTSYSYAEVRAEYATCRTYLQTRNWTRGLDLAIYPVGSLNALVQRALSDLGFRLGRITSGNIQYAYPNLPGFRTFEIPCWGGGGSAQAAAGYGVAGGFNTGNGTISTPTFTVGCPYVDWLVTLTAATTFEVRTVDGDQFIGTGSTGAAFTFRGVSFTITAGGTPFVAGDSFRVVVVSSILQAEKEIIRRGAVCSLYWHDIIRSGSVTSTQMLRSEYRAIIDEISRDVERGRVNCPTFSEFAKDFLTE